ncbi:LLM class flavin-dependent oxidoreductase [Microbacterium sediminis]|uniref:Oxidoreductase n=1 Tax=Microbacterium sediminis TaxID=904291 RepID=A0A1B9N9J6_9MICO|nr:LLM class flavin-dependent oxidoreductase [Microbacterium sediminis]OCG73272.1 oxidoreductase [Microbacterium sediminis]QBR75164.1 LLM class flavin-dependent oxidoreductase [Microbacterium sediminis]
MALPTMAVTFRPQLPPERLHDVVTAADQAGIDELWLWEDCFLEGGIATASAALARSERVRIGLGLLPVPLRNPALAAMELATLERLAPGRVIAGFGHGVLDWMGQVGARVASPLTLLREYVTAVRSLLEGGTVDAAGRYVSLRDVALDWPPAAAPQLVIGATGPKTLRLAGELGDGVVLSGGTSPDDVRAARAIIDEGYAASGRDGRSRVTVYVPVDTTLPRLADHLRERAAAYGDAGADAVSFEAPADSPDPRPIIDALAG